MKINFVIFLLLVVSFRTFYLAQTSDAKVGSLPDFELSAEAKAAGIDGKLIVDLTIGADGKASNFKSYGTPMWPCGENVKDELLEDVRNEVKRHLLSAKFEPAMKNGKPKTSDVQVTFLLSEAFRRANNYQEIEDNLKRGIDPPLVDVKDIRRFAVTLPKQVMPTRNSPSYRITEMQILVDENGNVISAGGLRSGQLELREARRLVCEAKFKPLILSGKPVKMTGVVVYGLY